MFPKTKFITIGERGMKVKTTKKRLILVILFLFASLLVYAHPEIKELSYFRVQGEVELHTVPDFTSPGAYKTLNHEGGLKVRVLKMGEPQILDGQRGIWLYVLLTASLWVESGDWIKKYRKFWIYLPDNTEIFDFEQ